MSFITKCDGCGRAIDKENEPYMTIDFMYGGKQGKPSNYPDFDELHFHNRDGVDCFSKVLSAIESNLESELVS